MLNRLAHFFGGGFLLIGAFVLGWVAHHAFFVGDLEIGSPVAVLSLAIGAGMILLGRYLESFWDPASVVTDDVADDASEDEFDAAVSPLDEGDFDDLERDDPE